MDTNDRENGLYFNQIKAWSFRTATKDTAAHHQMATEMAAPQA
jgi:hypothetical protein